MNIRPKYPEVLSPAGDLNKLYAAINFGADAVYIGGKNFGMRAASGNFDIEQMKEGVEFAHEKGVRVYLTLNTMPRNDEIDELPEYLKKIDEVGLDAVIVADMGVLMMVKEILPKMEIHMSTQAGIVNYATANAFYQMGARRVVLAREMSLEQIKEIRKNTPKDLEIECFVHGAMCMSVSGRCLISNYFLDRDANRGECAQPCRWKYYLVNENRLDDLHEIKDTEEGSYILNAKDLCMIEYIKQLDEAGISSFKIEGRVKSEYYVSAITNAYRLAVDDYLLDKENYSFKPWLLDEVKKVSHREYSTGFYFGSPKDGQYYESSGYVRTYNFVGIVTGNKDGKVICLQKGKFFRGDRLEVLSPQKKPYEIIIEELFNEDGEVITDTGIATMTFMFSSDKVIPSMSILRKKA